VKPADADEREDEREQDQQIASGLRFGTSDRIDGEHRPGDAGELGTDGKSAVEGKNELRTHGSLLSGTKGAVKRGRADQRG
jgi:hypothetical protein